MRRVSLLIGVLVMRISSAGAQEASSFAALDHIILRVPHLERAIGQFSRRTGVTPVRGGQHPGRGTENALVSLGQGHYLELLAPINPDNSARPDTSLRLVGWALHTMDLSGALGRLSKAGFEMSPAQPGSRRTTQGALLEWRSANLVSPALELAPFLIEWATGTPHPSTTSPSGCRLVSVELESPDATRLGAYLREIGYRGAVHQGQSARGQVTLTCPKGRLALRS